MGKQTSFGWLYRPGYDRGLAPGAWEVIPGISVEDRPACKITHARMGVRACGELRNADITQLYNANKNHSH